MPKVNRHGKAEILPREILKKILDDKTINLKHRALVAVLFYTAGRIGEVCSLKRNCVGTHITFEKDTTKMGKTRQVLVHPQLAAILDQYLLTLPTEQVYLFAGVKPETHYSKDTAAKVLNKIFTKYGLKGCSTHSFRRSILTHAHQNGASMADLQQLSGHTSLSSLQQYLQCSDNAQIKVLGLVSL